MGRPHPTSVPELLDRIEHQRRLLIETIDNLPAKLRDEVRDTAGWSTKDHLAHLSLWERSIDYLLNMRRRYEGLGVSRETYLTHDVDLMNDEIYRQHRDRDWDDVRTEFDQVHASLVATIEAVEWEGLQRTYSDYAPDEPGEETGTPVIFYVADNTFFHYDEHRAWINELTGTVGNE